MHDGLLEVMRWYKKKIVCKEIGLKVQLGKYDLIVVGSGISGATVAYIAAHDYHQRVLVLERAHHVGGLTYDEVDAQTGLLVNKCGLHVLHTNNHHVYKFLSEISEWNSCILQARAEIGELTLPLPFNFTAIDQLVAPELRQDLKMRILKKFNFEPFASLFEMLRCDDESIHSFARILMEIHFIPMIAQQRGVAPSKLDGNVLQGNYFTCSYQEQCYADRYQMLPKQGFTALITKMLTDPYITLQLDVNAARVITIDEEQNEMYYGSELIDIPVVYTGGLDELFEYRFGELGYYSMFIEQKTECIQKSGAPCVISDKNAEYLTCTDFSKLNDGYKGGKTVITYERSERIDQKNISFAGLPHIEKKMQRTYQKYRCLANKIDGLFLCGRLAEYRAVNMGDAVAEAMAVFSRLRFKKMDLTPDHVKYKRPPEQLLNYIDNYKLKENIQSQLLIGNLSRDLPKVTVIIPTYKRLEMLKRTLSSVWNQDIPKSDYDILVVDNDSDADNETYCYLREHATENLYYYKNSGNLGAYGNMNRCIELARTEWVSMVHDDDVLFSNALRWALNSKDVINDPKTGIIIPRQLQAHSEKEILNRMKERGLLRDCAIKEHQTHCPNEKRRWRWYHSLFEDSRRRYWRISKFDCYMIPFLYPAPSYGTLINRKAMLDIGGYSEGYPTDDNLCCVRMSEKYHCYLCGESWGLYSFYTADVMKPRSALQFVDAVVQYRLYMEKHSIRCWLMGKILRQGAYLDAVCGDADYGFSQHGYNTAFENYQYYSNYHASERSRKWCRRLQKVWETWVLARTKLFGKRIDFELIKRSNGEHF